MTTSPSRHSLQGKTVLIAGGAKNLGGLLARDFAQHGAGAVAVHYNSDATRAAAEETVAAVKALGADAHAWQADLTRAATVQQLFADAKARFGRIDIAINSKAAFFFIQQAGQTIEDHGKILTLVSSLLGAFTPFYASYAGSKAPAEHFTRAAAKELGERGISVTAVGPGPMDTPFFYGQESPEAQAYHKTAAALSQFSKTGLTDIEDVVPLIRHLVTDGWWMTGQTILQNGGYTTK